MTRSRQQPPRPRNNTRIGVTLRPQQLKWFERGLAMTGLRPGPFLRACVVLGVKAAGADRVMLIRNGQPEYLDPFPPELG